MTIETILTDDDITKALVTNGTFLSEGEVSRYDIDFARAIEQAVLQSPEVQAWKRDAERYHEIRSRLTGQAYDPRYFEDLFIAGCMGHPDVVDGEIDAEMEEHK